MELEFEPIDPPLEFQDSPGHMSPSVEIEKFAAKLVTMVIADALSVSCKVTWSIPCSQVCHMSDSVPFLGHRVGRWTGLRLCWTPELVVYSPCHGNRPASRSSLSSSRLSSSHNSLTVPGANKVDDSSFITSAMSHDMLSDLYNVPFDSDIYAVPVDVVRAPKPPTRSRKHHHRKRRHQSCQSTAPREDYSVPVGRISSQEVVSEGEKRRSMPGGKTRQPRSSSAGCSSEPIHLTLHEVRQYLQTLYSSSSDNSSDNKHLQETFKRLSNPFKAFGSTVESITCDPISNNNNTTSNNKNYYCKKNRKNALHVASKSKKAKETNEVSSREIGSKKTSHSFSSNIKQTLCNIFRWRRLPTPDQCLGKREHVHVSHSDEIGVRLSCHVDMNPPSPITKPPFSRRALPPLPRHPGEPPPPEDEVLQATVEDTSLKQDAEQVMDFASSIQKVKDYGWYWGPISGEAAEKILSNEPDGSFIVRDSSDDYYIFSLTFKLNSIVRHVRIEHDQGSFSFGSSTRFKSHTIVDFIESAVEHSRSGRYLFFLHRRPVLGPMRVQLLHPVSRFKQVQSLQHMCRFVILKQVRRDLIPDLPLPRRLVDYLSTPHYYTEEVVEDEGGETQQPAETETGGS